MRALFILGGFAATAVCVDFHRPLYPFNHFRREAALTNSSTTTTTTTTTSSSITTQLSNSTTTTNSSMPFCTGCVIEVIGVVTLTYTAPVTTYTPPVTIVVTPLIITGTDGSITTTTVPATTPANATFGFSNMTALVTDTNSLTFTWWGAPDIIMTYPTTYLGFSDFAGGLDTMTIRSQDLQPACTQSTTELDIDPTVLDIDSVEYRVKATMMLPEDLLSYVSGFADVKSIFSGVALTDCTAQPVTTTSVTGGESFLTTSSEGPELSTSTVVSFPTSYAPASHTSIQGPLMGPSNSGGVQSHGNIASGGGGVNPIGKVTASVGGGTGFGPQKPAPPSPPAQQTASEKGFGNVIASILAAGPNGPTASPPGQKPNNPANPPPQQENNPNTPNNPSKPNDENGNNPPSQTITIGGQPVVITPAPQKTPGSSQNGPGGIILPNGQTLGAGQSTTLNGVIVSVPPSGSSVVISNPNGGPASTVAINQPAGVAPPSQTVTIGGQPVVITPAPAGPSGGVILPNGQTLAPGQTTTLNGVLISVPPGGSQIVIGGTSTVAITPADNPAAPLITSPPVLTVAGLAVSPTVSGGSTWYSIAPGVTLTPGGPAVTVSGTTYSLPPGNTVLLINGQTSEISLGPASASATTTKSKTGTSSTTSSQSKAPGDYVASGVGASSTSKKSGAAPGRPPLEGWVEGLLITIAGWLLF